MRVLILGGAGFIGRNLLKRLLNQPECTVVSFDIVTLPLEHSRLQQIVGNFCCDTDFESLTKEVDVVMHCISTTSPRNFSGFYHEFQSNVMPTIRLLDACRKNQVKRVFYLSSGGTVYGESNDSMFDEEHVCNPICAYGVHKLSVEKIMGVYTLQKWVKCTVVRLANPYGPEQMTRGVGVISHFIRTLMKGEPIHVIGNSTNLRDYIYIDDVVDAVETLLRYQGDEMVFNIGTGIGVSVDELISIISAEMGGDPNIIYEPSTGLDVSRSVLDISKLVRETGFTPRYSLENGIQKMIYTVSEGAKRKAK